MARCSTCAGTSEYPKWEGEAAPEPQDATQAAPEPQDARSRAEWGRAARVALDAAETHGHTVYTWERLREGVEAAGTGAGTPEARERAGVLAARIDARLRHLRAGFLAAVEAALDAAE